MFDILGSADSILRSADSLWLRWNCTICIPFLSTVIQHRQHSLFQLCCFSVTRIDSRGLYKQLRLSSLLHLFVGLFGMWLIPTNTDPLQGMWKPGRTLEKDLWMQGGPSKGCEIRSTFAQLGSLTPTTLKCCLKYSPCFTKHSTSNHVISVGYVLLNFPKHLILGLYGPCGNQTHNAGVARTNRMSHWKKSWRF